MHPPKIATIGFESRNLPVASSRLAGAVVATLAVAALLLFASVGLTFLTTCVSVAMPLTH